MATGTLKPSGAAPVEVIEREHPTWMRWSVLPFALFHLVPLLAVFTGVTGEAVVIGIVAFYVRMFAVTAGYHRYFSHKTFKTSRAFQFVLAFLGTTCAQRGPLWWAAHHRAHHRYADTDRDPHNSRRGFWWCHIGWVLSGEYSATDHDGIKDFGRYPELRFLNKHDAIGPWTLAVICYLLAGWSGVLIGFFASTVVLWHATFLINSGAHMMGRRRYDTADTSRNSLILALLTMGEGWHNNHHHYPASTRQGFRWYQIDLTYLILRALAAVHIVRDLREPTEAALASRVITR